MSHFSDLLPATKSEKHGAFTWEPSNGQDNEFSPFAGFLTLTGKRCHCTYRVEEFPSDMGRGFMLFKIFSLGSDRSEARYGCMIGARASVCECKGYYATGRCKHLAALAALIAAGQL